MTPLSNEAEFLRNAVSELEHDGYEVFPQPTSPVLPPFLKDFRPDIIARRGDQHLVVEVVSTLRDYEKELASLASVVRSNPGWELRIIIASPTSDLKPLAEQSNDAIVNSTTEVRALITQGHLRAALLMGWSTFEAIGRTLMPKDFARPQSPGRLVQLLAQEGYLAPTEADVLRKLADKRNGLIHGNVLTEVSQDETKTFVAILEKLIELESSSG